MLTTRPTNHAHGPRWHAAGVTCDLLPPNLPLVDIYSQRKEKTCRERLREAACSMLLHSISLCIICHQGNATVPLASALCDVCKAEELFKVLKMSSRSLLLRWMKRRREHLKQTLRLLQTSNIICVLMPFLNDLWLTFTRALLRSEGVFHYIKIYHIISVLPQPKVHMKQLLKGWILHMGFCFSSVQAEFLLHVCSACPVHFLSLAGSTCLWWKSHSLSNNKCSLTKLQTFTSFSKQFFTL